MNDVTMHDDRNGGVTITTRNSTTILSRMNLFGYVGHATIFS